MTRFIQGPQGPPGPPGIRGPQGFTGLTGAAGVTGYGGSGQTVPARLRPPTSATRVYYTCNDSGSTLVNHGAAGSSLNLSQSVSANTKNQNGFFDKAIYHITSVSSLAAYAVSTSEGTTYTASTIHFWFQSLSTSPATTVNFGFRSSGNPLSEIQISNVTADFYTNNVLGTSFASSFSKLTWHHVGVTFDGSDQHFYLDGLLVGSETSTPDYASIDQVVLELQNAGVCNARIENNVQNAAFFVDVYRRAHIHDPV